MALTLELRQATAADLDAVRALLREAELPLEGLEDQFPAAYAVGSVAGSTVGVAGLEVHGSEGLLRSLAVAPAFRGAGVGRELVSNRVACARSSGLRRVFLLTTTAARYFQALGFRPASRADASEALSRSPEFASVCPATAACLCLEP